MHLLRLRRGGSPSGPDRPDRLVGDEAAAHVGFRDVDQGGVELTLHHREGGAAVPLAQGLADADDRDQPGGQRGARLAVHVGVGLAHELPPLRMADDHVAATGIDQLGRGYLAREGALRLPVAILTSNRDAAAPEPRGHGRQGDEGGGDDDIGAADAGDPRLDVGRQRDGLRKRSEELPVAREDRAFLG